MNASEYLSAAAADDDDDDEDHEGHIFSRRGRQA